MGKATARDYERPVFITVIGLSAFLLFALELLTGRLLLPVFGGLPAVWTTALCFYSGIVFIGYAYAHVLTTRLSVKTAAIAHVAFAAVTVATAVLAPHDVALLRLDGIPTVLNVLVALSVLSGAPTLLLATTTPLLSARYVTRYGDAWWLYAVSNAASLVGLLVYPFLIQPLVPLSIQRNAAIALLSVVALGIMYAMLRAANAGAKTPPGETVAPLAADAPPRPRTQALWLFAAFIPAGLLSAVTAHITMDLTPAPLLWIGPLAAYLGSFIIAFSGRGRRMLPMVERLVPAAATVMWIPFVVTGWHLRVVVPLLVLSYAVIATAVHGRLATNRPADRHLTRYYLLLSAGGFLATTFVAIAAPLVFDALYEYPILVVGALVALALMPASATPPQESHGIVRQTLAQLTPYILAGSLLAAAALSHSAITTTIIVVLAVGLAAIVLGRSWWLLALTTALAITSMLVAFSARPLVGERSFFGVTRIESFGEGSAYAQVHGTTIHGVQYLDDRNDDPTAYYVEDGPFGDAARDLHERRPQGASVGVVGLGVGTMAAYMRPTDSMTFFEVNPTVVRMARDQRYFTYLANASGPTTVVLGDARVSLADVSDASFDLLVLDAFSSDSIPAHLLTQEAMRMYVAALKPDGLAVFHLSNTYLDLAPAVASTAESIGLSARTLSYDPEAADFERYAAVPSVWLIVGRPDDVTRFERLGWSIAADGPILTDDFADVTRLLYTD